MKIFKFISIVGSGLSLFVSLASFAATDTGFTPLTVKEVRDQNYFSYLDYRQPETLAFMPFWEERLRDSADYALQLPDSDPYFANPDNSLIFIYAALYMDAYLEANRKGYLSAETMLARPLGSERTTAEETSLRVQRIITYVNRARVLRPLDGRVIGWDLGLKAIYQGRPYFDELMGRVASSKTPFLFITALILSQQLQITFTDEQHELMDSLVDKVTNVDSPCLFGSGKNQCRNSPLAPFSGQSGTLMIADYLMRRAETEKNQRLQNIDRVKSWVIYNFPYLPGLKTHTEEWRNKDLIKPRLDFHRSDDFKSRKGSDFWTTPQALEIYRCSSCHAPAVSPAAGASIQKEMKTLFN